jgi:8-oxo-dGTP pyrophosphatase MutT (NUDIX family)
VDPLTGRPAPPSLRQSAVLIPLYERDGAPQLLFIKRTDRVTTHRGEIGFPGGRIEPEDASPLAAALREAEEELGIPPESVMPLGALSPVSTVVTSTLIYPFAGRLAAPPELRPDPFEVAEVVEVPLMTLLDPATFVVEDWVLRGTPRTIFIYRYGPYDIWGATGRIVQQFLALLSQWPGHPPGAPWTLDEVAAVLSAARGEA